MESNEQKKIGRDFGFTALKTTEQKLEEVKKPEVRKIIEGEQATSPAVEKLKAMQKFKLKADMVNVTGEIDYEEFDNLKKILSELQREDRYKKEEDKQYWTQKKLVAHYVNEGIKRDKKKF